MTTPGDDEPVPRLPRGRGLRLDGAMLMRIGMTLALLVMVLVTAKPCADATSKFVTGFGDGSGSGSAAQRLPRPDTVDVPVADPAAGSGYVRLRPGMTDAEVKAAIDEAKRARAAGGGSAGSGSAGSGSAGSESAGSGAN